MVPLSNKDIGYLPGDIQSKMDPYMQPIWDNLKLIKGNFEKNDGTLKRIEEMVQNEKITVAPLAYIRGRSLSNIFFIVDEAQNLTPLEVKTVISRAGEGTKVIFTREVHQIDTPYLDSDGNGLCYFWRFARTQGIFAADDALQGRHFRHHLCDQIRFGEIDRACQRLDKQHVFEAEQTADLCAEFEHTGRFIEHGAEFGVEG